MLTRRLRAPYNPDHPIPENTSTHQELHAIAQANGNPISDAQHVDFLITNLQPCAIFNGRIDHWVVAFTTVALQRIQGLADALHIYSDIRTPDLTTSSAGYVSAVRSAQLPPLSSGPKRTTGVMVPALTVQKTALSARLGT